MILFDKPQGWTSHDAAEAFPEDAAARDQGPAIPAPSITLATGLLILLVGHVDEAASPAAGRWDKVYSGLIRLRDRDQHRDVTGKTVEQKEVPALSLAELQRHARRAPGFAADGRSRLFGRQASRQRRSTSTPGKGSPCRPSPGPAWSTAGRPCRIRRRTWSTASPARAEPTCARWPNPSASGSAAAGRCLRCAARRWAASPSRRLFPWSRRRP